MSTPHTPVPPPASDLVVRVAREDEYVAIGALTVAGYDHDGHLSLADGSYDQRYADWLADAAARGRDDVLIVALLGDRLVGTVLVGTELVGTVLAGTVTWCPYGSASAQLALAPHQGEFRTLAVDPSARGRGVARALVLECLDRGRAEGLTEVLLCSRDEMLPAHALYTSMGFGRRPDLDWSPAPGVQLWAFSLDL